MAIIILPAPGAGDSPLTPEAGGASLPDGDGLILRTGTGNATVVVTYDFLAGLALAGHSHASADVDIVAMAAVTVTQDDALVIGNGANNEQTVIIRYVSADGVTTLTDLVTVTVPANSVAAITPGAFSQAMAKGDRLRLIRTAGTGAVPSLKVEKLA